MAGYRILVAGGGPAAVEAVLTLRALAPAAEVTCLAPDDELVYRPLSVTEPFAGRAVRRYPLRSLEELGARFHQDRLAAVEPENRVVVTGAGEHLDYDALLIATGARPRAAVDRATTFTGPETVASMHGIVQDVEGGYLRSVAFFAPPGAGWTLPLYELALQTAQRAFEMGLAPALSITSSEQQPLDVFGSAAADFTAGLLADAGIAFATADAPPAAGRVVAIGTPEASSIPGLPQGFLPIDEHCAVAGVPGVWAAGDVTDGPIKQGGLATQQAAAAAAAIAAAAGAGPAPDPYLPVLRALLIAGRRICYFRRRLDGIDLGQASHRPLWWPPSKIAGARLAPYLDELDARCGIVPLERRVASRGGRLRGVISPGVRTRLT